MILADYGADVVKVEKPGQERKHCALSWLFLSLFQGQGDDTRTWGPPYVEDQSAYFLSINRNKRSIAVDMSRPAGQKIIRQVGSIIEKENNREKDLIHLLASQQQWCSDWKLSAWAIEEIRPWISWSPIHQREADLLFHNRFVALP